MQTDSRSEDTVNPSNHRPSPLAALSHYERLHGIVVDMQRKLPGGMVILTVLQEVRDRTWDKLKEIMSKYVLLLLSHFLMVERREKSKIGIDYGRNLLTACEAIKWPLKVDYPSLGARERRDFERAYQDLLYLQSAYVKCPRLIKEGCADSR
jgi:hypothetical protein